MLYYGFDKIIKIVHTHKRCPAVRKNFQYQCHGHPVRDLRVNSYEDLADAMRDGYVTACPLCFKSGGNAFTIMINNHVEKYLLTDRELNALVLMGDYMDRHGERGFSLWAAMTEGKITSKQNWYNTMGLLYKKGLVERKQYAKSKSRKVKERVRCFTPYGAAIYAMYLHGKDKASRDCPPQEEYKRLQ